MNNTMGENPNSIDKFVLHCLILLFIIIYSGEWFKLPVGVQTF